MQKTLCLFQLLSQREEAYLLRVLNLQLQRKETVNGKKLPKVFRSQEG